MHYLLFILYFVICCYLITRSRFVKSAQPGGFTILFLFAIKVAAGIFAGWITGDKNSDYWMLNNIGQDEYLLLVSDPLRFVTSIFESNYNTYDNYFGASNSYWNDLPTNIIIKIIGLLNIFTRGNYYLNSIFFNLIGLFGCVALYKVFINIYPGKKWQILIGCFLLPSTLMFTAGIHKDVIIFTLLSFFCYAMYFSLAKKFTLKRICIIIFSFLSILLLRSYIAIVLVPASVAWIFAIKAGKNYWKTFAAIYAICIACLLLLQMIRPAYTPLKVISDKQKAFFNLGVARSQLPTDTLYPTTQSFFQNAPQALNHSFLRPYPFEFDSLAFQNLFSLEIICYICLLIAMIFLYKKQQNDPFILFSIILTFSIFLIVGYIVPNAGAIERYRSIFFPWLITPILCHINLNKLKKSGSTSV